VSNALFGPGSERTDKARKKGKKKVVGDEYANIGAKYANFLNRMPLGKMTEKLRRFRKTSGADKPIAKNSHF
tara:strand:+ start:595 stop:810 length:216 start_codon:yes stop_codon:yes gene_type:complete